MKSKYCGSEINAVVEWASFMEGKLETLRGWKKGGNPGLGALDRW